jgi:hypothetical protein
VQLETDHSKSVETESIVVKGLVVAGALALAWANRKRLGKLMQSSESITAQSEKLVHAGLSLFEHADCAPPKSSEAALKLLESQMAHTAAERIDSWYTTLDPRLGVHLTDPNVVLTLANARSETEFFIRNPLVEDAQAFAKLNEITKPQGIEFRTVDLLKHQGTGEPILGVHLISTAGLEKTISESRLPGVPPFKAAETSRGDWISSLHIGLEKAKSDGHYPVETDLHEIYVGLVKGYPDEAILAASLHPFRDLAGTNIRCANFYPCAQPNYYFALKDSAAIEKHANHWGSILEQYFTSAEHQKLAATPEFMRFSATR